MNNNGSMGLAILSMLGVIIIGFMFVNFLMPEITQFRTDMNCANADEIHDGTKLLCLVADLQIPYWIILVLSVAIGAITSRVVF